MRVSTALVVVAAIIGVVIIARPRPPLLLLVHATSEGETPKRYIRPEGIYRVEFESRDVAVAQFEEDSAYINMLARLRYAIGLSPDIGIVRLIRTDRVVRSFGEDWVEYEEAR